MLQSNGRIKNFSTFLIVGTFLSFLAGEADAIRGTCDRHEDNRRVHHRYRHHHHRHHHHKRYKERQVAIAPGNTAPKKVVPAKRIAPEKVAPSRKVAPRKAPPQRSCFGLRRQAKPVGKSVRGTRASKRRRCR